MSIRNWLIGAAAALILFVVISRAAGRRSEATPQRPNIILISIDTLRPDHLGCYGYPRNTSPAIDAFRREAVLFRTTIASAPATLLSHSSIFTSLAPQHHGASHTSAVPLGDNFLTVTEVLRTAGYRTAAVTGGGQLSAEYGLNQGFQAYETVKGGTLEQVVARATPFLEQNKGKPFFLFLHTYEVHHPYSPTPEDLASVGARSESSLPSYISIDLLHSINYGGRKINDADRAQIVSAYDAEIHAMDRGFRTLVKELTRLGLYENALIVFTSDHGEEFGEHGFMGWHSHSLYEELLRIPLIVRFPRRLHAGLTVEGMVRGVDIAPIMLQAAGVPGPPPFDGFSLRTALARRQTRDSEVLLGRESPPGDPEKHAGLRTVRWKLIDGQLYDLHTDPSERKNLAAGSASQLGNLTGVMAALIRQRQSPDTQPIAPDQETIRQLRSLGYLQ